MGGLVVKEAYALGKSDRSFSKVVSRVTGFIFLATPHHGLEHAHLLNTLLNVLPNRAPARYVEELDPTSPTPYSINQRFLAACESLHLVSVYETQQTRIRGFNVMIVGQEAGVLNHAGEKRVEMNADHHTVCKFAGRDCPNYDLIRSVIRNALPKRKGPARRVVAWGRRRLRKLPH
ncbi:hypothetical protein VTJ49DRAFT_1527 [Mycothermus thermophilus]|uniref:Uncharacterized protein n=1 Tax=Humicola insolens TaxID=85995 RepID=A0ABR3VDB6_HUMIN